VLRELLKHGANVNTAKKDGDTRLHIAGGDGHVEVVRVLLNYGAKVNTANKGGFTPLYVAFQKGHIEVVRELFNNGTTSTCPIPSAKYRGVEQFLFAISTVAPRFKDPRTNSICPPLAAERRGVQRSVTFVAHSSWRTISRCFFSAANINGVLPGLSALCTLAR